MNAKTLAIAASILMLPSAALSQGPIGFPFLPVPQTILVGEAGPPGVLTEIAILYAAHTERLRMLSDAWVKQGQANVLHSRARHLNSVTRKQELESALLEVDVYWKKKLMRKRYMKELGR